MIYLNHLNRKENNMNNKYSEEVKKKILDQVKIGAKISDLSKEFNIARKTIYVWIKNAKNNTPPSVTERKEISELKRKIKKLETMLEIIRKCNCSYDAPLKEKLYALEQFYGQYNIHWLCEALGVDRGTFYNHVLRNKKDNTSYAKRREELKVEIQNVYDEYKQIFGAHKIAALLKQKGITVSYKMVEILMNDMGLTSIRQRAKAIYEKEQKRGLKNEVQQNFKTNHPNQVWVSDVTYFKYNNKGYYICAIIDLYSRMVIAYKTGNKNSTQLIKSTFKIAYESRRPSEGLIFHTDRGTNYCAYSFVSYLRILNVITSYSRAHIPYDNSVMESFFSTLKREELYRHSYRSEHEIRKGIEDYIIFYNTKRPHSTNNYKTPSQKEAEYNKLPL